MKSRFTAKEKRYEERGGKRKERKKRVKREDIPKINFWLRPYIPTGETLELARRNPGNPLTDPTHGMPIADVGPL